MLHVRDEGGIVRQGLNFYPLRSSSSFGCIARIKHTIYKFRYSKVSKKWFIGKESL